MILPMTAFDKAKAFLKWHKKRDITMLQTMLQHSSKIRISRLNQAGLANKPTNRLVTKILALSVLASVLSACQSTPNDAFANSNYTANTQATGNREKSPKEVANIRTTLAGEYIRDNKLDAAMRQLQLAFEADSRFVPAYDMMGVLLQQEGSQSNFAKAEEYFKKAISIDPNFMQAHNNYGVYLSQANRYSEAVQQFEIAGSALGYQGRIGSLENLGRTYLKLGNDDAATQAFIRALEGDNNSIISRIELVDLLLKHNRIQQAQQLYDETNTLLGAQSITPRTLMQGIKLAHAMGNMQKRRQMTQELLSAFPLSDEAKTLRIWLTNPEAAWK